MKIILASCGNGYCGCDAEDVFFFGSDVTEESIQEDLWDWACDNAESYSHVHFGWGEDYSEEDYEDYLENYVTFSWNEITREEYLEWCDDNGYEPEDLD